LKDSPLRATVAEALRVAKYIARVVDMELRSDGVLRRNTVRRVAKSKNEDYSVMYVVKD
jgi:hypothetical protein